MSTHQSKKASLADFFRSIKFTGHSAVRRSYTCDTHFAGFVPQTHHGKNCNIEDSQLIRSAN